MGKHSWLTRHSFTKLLNHDVSGFLRIPGYASWHCRLQLQDTRIRLVSEFLNFGGDATGPPAKKQNVCFRYPFPLVEAHWRDAWLVLSPSFIPIISEHAITNLNVQFSNHGPHCQYPDPQLSFTYLGPGDLYFYGDISYTHFYNHLNRSLHGPLHFSIVQQHDLGKKSTLEDKLPNTYVSVSPSQNVVPLRRRFEVYKDLCPLNVSSLGAANELQVATCTKDRLKQRSTLLVSSERLIENLQLVSV